MFHEGGNANNKQSRHHPHFFHGLGPNARRLFLEIYAENRSRLLAPPPGAGDTGPALSAPCDGSGLPNLSPLNTNNNNHDDDEVSRRSHSQLASPTPRSVGSVSSTGAASKRRRRGGGGAADTVRHAAGAFAASGPPPDLDAAILDSHGALISRLVEAATRVQRVRRLGALPRAARRLRRRQRSALAVQRLFRGHLGRMYAAAWKTVSWLAATRLSAAWRRFVARREFLVLRARTRRGATGMQVLRCTAVRCTVPCWFSSMCDGRTFVLPKASVRFTYRGVQNAASRFVFRRVHQKAGGLFLCRPSHPH